MHRLLHTLASSPSTSTASYAYHRKAMRKAYAEPLDRVNELGNDEGYGHTDCVNALSWAFDGDMLISGGDDTTLRLWKQDPNDYSTPYPYKESSIIQTGHTGNIFNAHLLPSSSRIATVAGDCQVRVFDVERAPTTSSTEKGLVFGERETCTRVLKCHTGRTKRIVTEESSDLFLTVSNDGTVRQHDLRTPHQCDRLHKNCPPPLVTLPHDLSALSLSPLSPFLFVVAGESPYGYLFDRRQVGRTLQAEWGMPCTEEHYVTCVRRFGKPEGNAGGGRGIEHITGARMAQTNGHEVLLSYSADAVYLYSTRDQPQEGHTRPSSVLTPNRTRKEIDIGSIIPGTKLNLEEDVSMLTSDAGSGSDSSASRSASISRSPLHVDNSDSESNEEESDDDDDDDDDDDLTLPELDEKFKVPIIMPQRRFTGHCNVETVKDVNFVGVDDEFVASGSDDGNFFLWEKDTGRIHGIYEGDEAVVNVIGSHPRLPLIACSGIDTTVKLFSPTEKPASYSRTHNIERIVDRNTAQARLSARTQSSGFARLLWHYRLTLRRAAEDD